MIAREGLIFILSGVVLTTLTIIMAARFNNKILFSLSIVLGILTLFTTFFFRDPERSVLKENNILVAPADGKVVVIDTIGHDEFIGGEAVQISIFLSVFDVHVNRIPTAGTIDYVKYNPGQFLPAYREKASMLNEQTEIGMTSSAGQRLKFKQIAGLIARRIVCKLEDGMSVDTGDRFGLIRFGSRTDLIIPKDSRIDIKIGEHVAGGETVIGYLSGYADIKTDTSGIRGENVEL